MGEERVTVEARRTCDEVHAEDLWRCKLRK